MISTAPKGVEDADMSALFAAKSALRKSMLRTLRQIPEAELGTQSDAVFRSLLQQDFYNSARSVGCYLSMGKGELQTDKIVHDLLRRGVKLYTPYLPPPPVLGADSTVSSPAASSSSSRITMRMLRLYSPADLAACPLDKWAILDPGEDRRDTGDKREDGTSAPSLEDGLEADNLALDDTAPDLDVILIPGVAFDEECNRMGRGKAYYDRYLASYISSRQRPLLVALALTPQLLSADQTVPTTPDDFTLDGVITPERAVWREKRGKE